MSPEHGTMPCAFQHEPGDGHIDRISHSVWSMCGRLLPKPRSLR
jgi:hypothetical protein